MGMRIVVLVVLLSACTSATMTDSSLSRFICVGICASTEVEHDNEIITDSDIDADDLRRGSAASIPGED